MKNIFKSCVSLLLVACMLLGVVPATMLTAHAESTKKEIVYVSVGDSMTNGYCLPGYDGTSGGLNYGLETYSNQFAAWLAGYDGPIGEDQVIFEGEKAVVDHRQLAISGMRSQDFQWILELDLEDEAVLQALYTAGWRNTSTAWSEIKSNWYGSWDFAGDYITFGDVCWGLYRYADAAARVLAMYNHEDGTAASSKFTTDSNYLIDGAVNNAYNGFYSSNNTYFPESQAETNSIGGYKYFQILGEFYQESVEEADVISMAVGNTNFGTFMFQEIVNVVMNNQTYFTGLYSTSNLDLSDDLVQEAIAAIKADASFQSARERIIALAKGNATKEAQLEAIVDYCVAAYYSSYVATMKHIMKVNPDVDIIQIGLMNCYGNDSVSAQSEDPLDATLGILADELFAPVNTLMQAMPAKLKADLAVEEPGMDFSKVNFYYAEADTVECLVSEFGDDFYKEVDEYPGLLTGQKYTPNFASIVRDRFIDEIVYGDLLFKNMGINIPEDQKPAFYQGVVGYDLMTYFEKAAAVANGNISQDNAKAFAMYLALENALIRAGTEDVTLESVADLDSIMGVFMTQLGVVMGEINDACDAVDEHGNYIYYTPAAQVVAASQKTPGTDEYNALVAKILELMAVYESVRAQVWEAYAGAHATLKAETGHTKLDHILYCDTCKGTPGATLHGASATAQQILATYQEQMALLPYTIVAEQIKPMTNGFLDGADVKVLCETADSAAYEAAVYNLVYQKAQALIGEDSEYKDKLTLENVKYLGQENGAFKLVAVLSGVGIKWAASMKDGYDGDTAYYKEHPEAKTDPNYWTENNLDPNEYISFSAEEYDMITMLIQVSDGIRALLAPAYVDEAGNAVPSTEMQLKEGAKRAEEGTAAIEPVSSLAYLLALPQAMSDSLIANPDLRGALTLNARCLLGTGAGGHPTVDGHVAVYNAMLAAMPGRCAFLGHDYAEAKENAWTWTETEDGYTASVKLVCAENSEHTVDVDAEVKVETTAATCTDEGLKVYTATATYEGKTYTATKEVTLDALNHDRVNDEWASDENGHWHACKRCEDQADYAKHDFGDFGDQCACGYERDHVHRALTLTPAKDATCTDEGNIAYYTCNGCNSWYRDAAGISIIENHNDVVIPAKNHKYNKPDWAWAKDNTATLTMVCENDNKHTVPVEGVEVTSVTTEAKCEVAGKTVYTATASYENEVYTDTQIVEIKAREHSFTTYVPNNDAVCGKDGTKTATCDYEDCDETNTVTDAGTALIHSFTKYISDGNATCEKDGTKTATCDNGNCGAKHTVVDEGSALDHSFTDYIYDENATCTEDGTKTATCDRDGCGAKDTVVDEGTALSHSFTKYISDGNATCEKDGTKTAICDRNCGAKDTVVDEGSNLGHDYGETTYKWSEDNTSCTAERTCKREGCGYSENATATISAVVKIPAACETKGTTTYTATFDVEWAAAQTKDVADIPALIHNYGEPTWTWAKDYKSATATFVCGRGCEIDAVIVDKEIEAASKDATCEGKGEVTYTASVTFEGKDYTESETVIGTALGHDYNPDWTWSETEDGWTTELNMVCANDETHTYEVEVEVTAETTEATCEKDGEIIYTATSEDGEYTNTKSVKNGDATGHDYGDPDWNWAKDKKSATATFTCANDETHVETVDATVKSEVTIEAACEVKGEITYTATVVFEDETYTDVVKAETPALSHDWEDATCEDPKTCVNCGETEGDALGHDYNEGVCGNCGEADPDYEKPEEPTVPSTPVKPSKPNWTNIFKKWFGNWWGNGDDEEEKCDHSYKAVVTDPTCTEKGYTTHTCSKCGDSYKDSYVNALGHDYEDGKCTECGAKDPNANKPGKPTLPSWGNIFNKWFGNWWGKK